MDKIFKISLFISIISWLIPIITSLFKNQKGNNYIVNALLILFGVYFIADVLNLIFALNSIQTFIIFHVYTWISSTIIFLIFIEFNDSKILKLIIKIFLMIFYIIVFFELSIHDPFKYLNNLSYKFSIFSFFALSFYNFFVLMNDTRILNLKESFNFLVTVSFFIYFGFLMFFSLFENLFISSKPELQFYVLPILHFTNLIYSILIALAIWRRSHT